MKSICQFSDDVRWKYQEVSPCDKKDEQKRIDTTIGSQDNIKTLRAGLWYIYHLLEIRALLHCVDKERRAAANTIDRFRPGNLCQFDCLNRVEGIVSQLVTMSFEVPARYF